MKTPLTLALGSAAILVCSLLIPPSTAEAGGQGASGRLFQVTITNLTQAQIFSPPLLVTHGPDTALFVAGDAASPELAELAENGNNVPLRDTLLADPGAFDVFASEAMILPGETATFTVASAHDARLLSTAGMLVSTNDAFFALDGADFPRGRNGRAVHLVPAWDAGSEANSEDCAYIPGPPCGAGAVHDPSPAEGFVHINNGIHGIGGVPEVPYDWRNPVARIEIERL